MDAGSIKLCSVPGNMLKGRSSELNLWCSLCSALSCVASEDDDIKKRVAHQTVASMDTAGALAGDKKVVDGSSALGIDLDAAVLIVLGRIYRDRYLSHIDAILQEHSQHSRDSCFDGTLSSKFLDHRGIQPDRIAERCGDTFVSALALTDDTSCGYVAGLKRMKICDTILVDQLCAEGTDLLGYQSALDLRREGSSGRMILDGILVQQRSTCSVSKDQSVCGRSIVVGSREVLIMKPSCAAGSKDDNLCTSYQIVACLHVQKNSACNLSLRVLDQLDS